MIIWGLLSLIFFAMVFLVLLFLAFKTYRFVTKKPDFEQLEANTPVADLIQTLVDEISSALSLNKTEVIHKFNPNEPPIDGEVAANVTFRISQVVPCVIMFYYEANHDVRIVLQRMAEGN